MPTEPFLTGRGNAAARVLCAAFPGLTVVIESGRHDPARLSWVDGPTRGTVERLLTTHYRVPRLGAAHLRIRRHLSLEARLATLLTARVPVRDDTDFDGRLRDVPFPPGWLPDPQVQLAATLFLQSLPSGRAGIERAWHYPALRGWYAQNREQLTAVLDAVAADPVRDRLPSVAVGPTGR